MKQTVKKTTRMVASVSLHRQLYEKIQAMAEAESRTMSNILGLLVKEGLAYRENKRGSNG